MLGLFVLLTLVLTAPSACRADRWLRDSGDPLLNTWIITWDVHALAEGRVAGFFDANIFHPHHRTLAYSEHLFPQALIAAPVLLLSRNPVLAYNVVFLLGFVVSAVGMYALARRLTGSVVGAVLAGAIFAFCPFMMGHLAHVQILWAGGIPFAFLFLERLLDRGRWRDAAFLALAVSFQILANGYYALFLVLSLVVYTAATVVIRGIPGGAVTLVKLAAAAAVTVLVTAPFLVQYVALQREMGFSRTIDLVATLDGYLTVPTFNRLYGPWLGYDHAEAALFPGAVALVLAALGVVLGLRRDRGAGSRPSAAAQWRVQIPVAAALRILIVLVGGVLAAVTVTGRFDLGISARASDPVRPLIWLGVLAVAWAAVVRLERRRDGRPLSGPFASPLVPYLWVGFTALLCSFGEPGPFGLLSQLVPGFDGIRAVGRFHVVVMFVLALLAARGLAELLSTLPARASRPVCTVVASVLLLEYVSVPVPLSARVPVGEEIGDPVRWIAAATGPDDPILELPLPARVETIWQTECPRVYASVYHWRPLVNGFSGYLPPVYHELRHRWHERGLDDNLADARALGVRYLVVHREVPSGESGTGLVAGLLSRPEQVRLVEQLPDAWAFELLDRGTDAGSRAGERVRLPPEDGWRATASTNPESAPLAIDGRLDTRWAAGPQRPGLAFELDLGRPRLIAGVELRLADHRHDFPRGLRMEVDEGEGGWRVVDHFELEVLPIRSLLEPTEVPVALTCEPVHARRLRLTLTGRDEVFWWSIHELRLLGRGEGRSPGR